MTPDCEALDKIPVTMDDTQTPFAQAELRLRTQVGAILTRRAVSAGLSDSDYLREIKAGRAPRITRAEASREAVPWDGSMKQVSRARRRRDCGLVGPVANQPRGGGDGADGGVMREIL